MADPDPNPETGAEDLDVDEDGRKLRPRRVDQVPAEDQAEQLVVRNAAQTPAAKPSAAASSLVIVGQHFDVPALLSTLLQNSASKFLQRGKSLEVSYQTYWQANEDLDYIASLVAGQINPGKELGILVPKVLRDYWAIDDYATDWGDKIRRKVFQLSHIVKLSGLGTKDKPHVLAAVPSEAMQLRIRKELEPWQIQPDQAGVVQVAEKVAESIRKRRLMIMIIDVDPYSGIAFGGGKSQLLYECMYWTFWVLEQERGTVWPYDPRKDTIYRADRVRAKRMIDQSLEVPIGFDEVNQFFDMWEWQNPKNKYLVHQIEMYRKVGRPILGCCGSIWILNKRFRELIITHRLSITKWDDDNMRGEFTLFQKWGPPAAQDEKENKWGREELQGAFAGLTTKQFKFYSAIADKTREVEDSMGLDKYVSDHPDWLADQADAEIPLRLETPKEPVKSAES